VRTSHWNIGIVGGWNDGIIKKEYWNGGMME